MRFRLTPSISVVIAALSIEAKSSGANAAGSLRRHAPPVVDLARRPAWSFAAIRTRSTPSARRSSGVILRARSISSSWASRAPAAHNSRERERSPFAADEAIRTGSRRARSSKVGQGARAGEPPFKVLREVEQPLLKPTYGYLLSRFFVPPKRRCATTPTSTPTRAIAAHAENSAATTTKTTPTATAFQTTAFEGAIPQSNT